MPPNGENTCSSNSSTSSGASTAGGESTRAAGLQRSSGLDAAEPARGGGSGQLRRQQQATGGPSNRRTGESVASRCMPAVPCPRA